jgi:asparagine synthetase B (glutamine-hydrolysing)
MALLCFLVVLWIPNVSAFIPLGFPNALCERSKHQFRSCVQWQPVRVPVQCQAAAAYIQSVDAKVRAALQQHCGVQSGDTVLALCSGGADSTALLHALAAAARAYSPPLQLEVATFDHCLRAEVSALLVSEYSCYTLNSSVSNKQSM